MPDAIPTGSDGPGMPNAAITDAGQAAATAKAESAPIAAAPSLDRDEPANPSKRDWAANAKVQRDILAKLDALQVAPPPPSRSDDPPKKVPATGDHVGDPEARAMVLELRRDLEIERAFSAANVPTGKLRNLIELAVKQSKPTNIGEFVKEYAEELAPVMAIPAPAKAVAAVTTPAITPPPQAPGRLDIGPPGAAPTRLPISSNPSEVDGAVFKSLPLEERLKLVHSTIAGGEHVNPTRRTK